MPEINSFIEIKFIEEWSEFANAGLLLDSHVDLFGCLFGVTNYGHFEPLFPDRGVPSDLSDAVRRKYAEAEKYSYGATWVSWAELVRIDWDEKAKDRDERISEYAVDQNGNEVFVTKWLNKMGHDWIKDKLVGDSFYEHNNVSFRRNLLTRKDALAGNNFHIIMEIMKALSNRYDENSVRLVVYFDSY